MSVSAKLSNKRRQRDATEGLKPPMKEARKEDDYQKWVNFAKRTASGSNIFADTSETPCVRISNDRYAKDATFEERLTLEDRLLLKDMGITL